MTDPRPSIAELQRLAHDDTANHDADIALAAPVLLEIAAAALAWQTMPQVGAREARKRLLAALAKVAP